MKKVLYMFDDINYPSGAQKVTLFQMDQLKDLFDISVFSLVRPQKELAKLPYQFIGQKVWDKFELLGCSCTSVLKSKQFSVGKKISRVLYSVKVRFGLSERYIQKHLYKLLGTELELFDTVIVVSEASKLRSLVARLQHPKKIQWIHTDYALWSEFSEWTKAVTEQDGELYRKFDHIVALSEHSKQGLLRKLPALESKVVVIPNLIDGERILRMAEETGATIPDKTKTNLITVGRLEKEKALDRVLNICNRLKKQEKEFCWYIVGGGSLRQHLEKRIEKEDLQENVKLVGELTNPYPLMKSCDCLVLVSDYEGTPVTIDEAGVLGLTVVAKKVGGIEEQISRLYGHNYKDLNDETETKLIQII